MEKARYGAKIVGRPTLKRGKMRVDLATRSNFISCYSNFTYHVREQNQKEEA